MAKGRNYKRSGNVSDLLREYEDDIENAGTGRYDDGHGAHIKAMVGSNNIQAILPFTLFGVITDRYTSLLLADGG